MIQKIIVALDTDDINKAKKLVKTLWPMVKFFKIGLEMINTGQASELIKFIHKLGGKVFYDAKLNDIPNTVGRAVGGISKLGVAMISVHASMGREALKAAVKNKGRSKIIGVTILTSLGDKECKSIFGVKPDIKITQFVDILMKAGADGVVCSVAEAKLISKFSAKGEISPRRGGKKFVIVTPGIRPVWANKNEQSRIATPAEAVRAGADYLVIGRPITDPPKNIGSPSEALDLIIGNEDKV